MPVPVSPHRNKCLYDTGEILETVLPTACVGWGEGRLSKRSQSLHLLPEDQEI